MDKDLISRQDAIDALYKMLHDCFWADDKELDAVITILNDLPSAQPEKRTEKRTETHACDLINKVMACEILADIYPTDGEKVVAVKEVDKAYEAIQQLPSAQPEIIRCKDCKHYLCPHGCGHIDGMVTSREDGFCSHAERRTDGSDL